MWYQVDRQIEKEAGRPLFGLLAHDSEALCHVFVTAMIALSSVGRQTGRERGRSTFVRAWRIHGARAEPAVVGALPRRGCVLPREHPLSASSILQMPPLMTNCFAAQAAWAVAWRRQPFALVEMPWCSAAGHMYMQT